MGVACHGFFLITQQLSSTAPAEDAFREKVTAVSWRVRELGVEVLDEAGARALAADSDPGVGRPAAGGDLEVDCVRYESLRKLKFLVPLVSSWQSPPTSRARRPTSRRSWP